MRVMDDLIEDHDLTDELQERLIDETGNTNFWLGEDPGGMDEGSDQEDPEAILRRRNQLLQEEVNDKRAFVEGAQLILEGSKVVTDLERARMRLEDLRCR